MALRYKTKLPLAFRERDIEAFLSPACAFKQKLQRKRRLSGARLTFNQVQPFGVKATAQDVVQPGNASRQPLLAGFWRMLVIHWQQ